MGTLIVFEMKKFIHKKKSLLSILVFALVAVAFIALNMTLDKEKSSSEEPSLIYQMESIQDALTQVEAEIKTNPDNSRLTQIKESYLTDYSLLETMKNALVSQDTRQYLNTRITYTKKQMDDIASGDTVSFEGIEKMEQQFLIDNYLLDKNMEPINETASMQGFNFIRLFLDKPMSILFCILILILSADIMSSEYDTNTYKLLFTQPIGKVKIVISKLIALFLIINVSVSGMLAILFGLTSLINGVGTAKYPLAVYVNEATEYMEMGEAILLACIVYEVILLFLCVLSMLISCLCKNSTSAVSLAIILVVAGYMLSGSSIASKVAHLNPFIYFDISGVISGRVAKAMDNTDITWVSGVIVTGIWSMLIFISNMVYVKQKQL